ncbi:MAG: heavy-metal-associated domain-containing protein [Clostridia bacterium]|nr:heavy-metal-associated domain-containing protein [bacterium]MBR4111049.1 heavy-metal-associated domain-containing protein [Clostridia bacterium]
MKEMIIKVNGMMCAGCENRVQNAVKLLAGVENVTANHENGTVKVVSDENVTIESVKEAIEDLGFDIVEE